MVNLEKLKLGGGVLAGNNALLTDISTLSNVNPSVLSELTILDNPSLNVCNLPNFCTYLHGIGTRNISNNAGDCITEQAVIAACTVGVDDVEFASVQVYPNPAIDFVTLYL